MTCAECGREMRTGYLFSSKDGALSFANEVPSAFKNASKADGFVEITKPQSGHRSQIKAYICEHCRAVIVKY